MRAAVRVEAPREAGSRLAAEAAKWEIPRCRLTSLTAWTGRAGREKNACSAPSSPSMHARMRDAQRPDAHDAVANPPALEVLGYYAVLLVRTARDGVRQHIHPRRAVYEAAPQRVHDIASRHQQVPPSAILSVENRAGVSAGGTKDRAVTLRSFAGRLPRRG